MKLQELLSALKTQIKPEPTETYQRVMAKINADNSKKQGAMVRLLAYGIIALLLIAGVGVYTFHYFHYDNSNNLSGDTATICPITYVAADQINQNGVANNTTLTIVTKDRISATRLEEHLSITPAVPYSLKKVGANRFSLRFDEILEDNASYTVNALMGNTTVFRWSLQTDVDFGIVSVDPADHGVNVPCDTIIRVTFTESSVNAFQEYFSIYPEVTGSFVHKGRVWSFTPDAPLSPFTTYTVTINGDVFGSNATLGKDLVYSFTTDAGESGRYAYVIKDTFDIADSFSTTQSPSVTVGAKGLTTTTADMTVYKLPDAKTYLALHQKYGREKVLSSAILAEAKKANGSVYSQFSVSAIPDPEQKDVYHFNYPKELESGYYLTEILWNELKCYQLVQSNDLAVYSAAYNGEHTFWVNNTQTKLPADGVKIEFGEETAKTDKNGLAVIAQKDTRSDCLYATIKESNLPPYILCCPDSEISDATAEYNAYFCTDSAEYTTDGVVKIWGNVGKRISKAGSAAFRLSFNRFLENITIEPDADGTFTAEIPMDGIESGDLVICLQINDVSVRERTIAIIDTDFENYRIDVSSNKNVFFPGETANFTVNAAYYDRLPAIGMEIKAGNVVSTTDAAGQATLSLPLNAADGSKLNPQASWSPVVINTKFEIIGNGQSHKAISRPVLLFNSTEYINGTVSQQTENSCTLQINTGKIDPTALNALTTDEFIKACDDLAFTDYVGAPTDKVVKIEIHDISFERTNNGTYYDAASNKVQLKYAYKEIDKIVKTVDAKTQGGSITLNDFALPTASGYRYLKLITSDSKGAECTVIIYLDKAIDHNAKNFKFDCTETAKYGDSVKLSVYDPTAKQNLQEGSFVYHLNNGKEISSFVAEENNATFEYKGTLGDEIALHGAYFDGKQYHYIAPETIVESNSKEIYKVKISADKETYLPGDDATVTIEVRDSTGNPVKNAAFCLNLTRAGTTLYSATTISEQLKYFERKAPMINLTEAQANGEPRKNTGATGTSVGFYSGKTDKNGKAALSIKLPEAVDTWNASVIAIGKTAQVGCSNYELKTEKEMAIIYQIAENATAGDDVILSFACNGSKVNSASVIQTSISVLQNDVNVHSLSIQHGLQVQYVNLGKLPEGEYTVKITANAGFAPETAEFPLAVSKSALCLENAVSFDAAKGEISNLLLTDRNNALLPELLEKMYADGELRVDKHLGRVFAETIFNGKNASDSYTLTTVLRQYQVAGGYAPYPGEKQPDLLLTAKLVSLFPENVDKEACKQYFDSVLGDADSEYEQVLCALWGKAALGEAFEKDLAYYYAEGNGLTSEQQLYFALGYAYGGNQAKAYDIYINRLKTMLMPQEEKLMLTPDDVKRNEHCNSMLSLLLTRISAKEAPQVLAYVQTIDSDVTLATLAEIGYVKEYAPALDGTNTVEVGIADVGAQTFTYSKCSYLVANIDARFEELTIKDETENTVISALAHTATHEWIAGRQKAGVIAMTVPPEAKRGDNVSISLNLTAAQAECGRLYIKFPAGLRFQKLTSNAEHFRYVANNAGNELTVTFESAADINLTLHCKAALIGEFVLEPMVIIADNGNAYHSTDATLLRILDPAATPVDGIPEENYVPEQPVTPEVPADPSVPSAPETPLTPETSIDSQV